MKNISKLIGLTAGIMTAIIPLSGTAYFCDTASANEPTHKTKDIQDEDILSTLGISARSCVLMEKSTGRVVLSRNKDLQLPMASMTKMMTLLLVMEEVEAGRIDLKDTTLISEYSASMEGSECFLDANKRYEVVELIKSVVVASANDSTVALAELVSGSEAMFVKKMNERAKALGMANTNFVNSTGLDAEGHKSSAHDMAKLMAQVSRFGLLRDLSKVWVYDMNHSGGRVTNLTNTNRLIRTNPDCVFAKTGHTDGAGYCITVAGNRDSTEFIACVMGEVDSATRFDDATKLLNFGFSTFKTELLADANEVVGEIAVKGGKSATIKVYPEKDLAVLVLKDSQEPLAPKIRLEEKLDAPVMESEVVGEMVYNVGGEEYRVPLITKEGIEEKSVWDIMQEFIN